MRLRHIEADVIELPEILSFESSFLMEFVVLRMLSKPIVYFPFPPDSICPEVGVLAGLSEVQNE
jgi:hypothetical protein